MGPSVFDQHEARTLVRERFDSQEWWLFVATPDCEGYISAIEERFYSGEAAIDFEVLLIPHLAPAAPPLTALFFGRKTRASALDLAPLMTTEGVNVAETMQRLAENNFLLLGTRDALLPIGQVLYTWVRDRDDP